MSQEMLTQPLITNVDALAAVEFYFEQGWTDGLPIIPPTVERVQAFLDAGGRRSDEVLLRIPENRRYVTVELSAINAVMAGCKPEYFPVIVAAMEGWSDERWGSGDRTFFFISNTSTGGGAQLLIVNGPIRNELQLSSGVNVFGSGNRANATIGRALRLILINALGIVPGVVDHASQGHPGKFSFCIAENEEESPWEPLHVEHGFAPDTSTVTTISCRSPEPVDNRVSNTPEGILHSVADTMSRLGALTQQVGNVTTVALGPEHAQIIARHGWSKRDVKQFLFENFQRPFADLARAGLNVTVDHPRAVTIGGVNYMKGCSAPENITVVVVGANNAGVSSVITPWAYVVPKGKVIVTPIASPKAPGPREEKS